MRFLHGALLVAVMATGGVQAQSPAPRSGHAAAWDPVHQRVVVFGGGVDGASPYPSDTWAWDGARWTQLATKGPPGRDDAVMSYDPLSKSMLLYGGRNFNNRTQSFRTDTWTFDGTGWKQRDSAGVGPREHEELVADGVNGPILIGGVNVVERGTFADAWRWNGRGWRRESNDSLPAIVLNGAVSSSNGVLSVGAALDRMEASLAPTHVYRLTNGNWLADTATGPSISPKVPVTAGPAPGSLVLFDAFPPSRTTATWIWQGGAWHKVAGVQPTARRGAAMVYDPVRKRVVLIGGDDGHTLLGDVWEFDGAGWKKVF